jgi:hypothetical protein
MSAGVVNPLSAAMRIADHCGHGHDPASRHVHRGRQAVSLASQWRDHGVVLPALDEPERTIAVLHQATGTNVVYIGSERYLWGYLAAIHEALRAATR